MVVPDPGHRVVQAAADRHGGHEPEQIARLLEVAHDHVEVGDVAHHHRLRAHVARALERRAGRPHLLKGRRVIPRGHRADPPAEVERRDGRRLGMTLDQPLVDVREQLRAEGQPSGEEELARASPHRHEVGLLRVCRQRDEGQLEQPFGQRDDPPDLAEGGADDGEQPHRAEPRRLLGTQEPERLHRGGARRAQVSAPAVRLGLQQAQAAQVVAVSAARDPSIGARHRGIEVVAAERLLRRSLVALQGPRAVAAALPVLGQHQGRRLPPLLEPSGCERVARVTVSLRQHRVGGLANDLVTERVLDLVGERRRGPAGQELTCQQPAQHLVHVASLEERGRASTPEGPPEHAGPAQQPPLVGPEPLEARLDHGQHAVGQRVAGVRRGRADQLLEEERVPRCAFDDPVDRRLRHVLAQRVPHEALARAPPERTEADLLHATLGPELGEDVVHVGPRQREHHQLRALEPQRRVEQLHARHVAPVQVLEHHQHRLRRTLGRQERLPRSPQLVAHDDGVRAGHPQLDPLLLGRRPEQLAQERRHSLAVLARHVSGDACPELAPAGGRGLPLGQADRGAQDLPEHPEGRTGAHRIAPGRPHLHPGRTGTDVAQQLVPQSRLAHPRGARHERCARGLLLAALVQHGAQRGQLAIASHAGHRLAEQLARRLGGLALAPQRHRVRVPGAGQIEARVEQRRGHVVHQDRAPVGVRARRLRQLRGAVDDLPHGRAVRALGSPRGQHDRAGGHGLAQREGAARRLRRLVCGAAVPREHGDERSVREPLDVSPEARDRGRDPLGRRVHVVHARGRIQVVLRRRRAEHDDDADEVLLSLPQDGRPHAGHPVARADVQTVELRQHRRAVERSPVGLLREHAGDEILQRGRSRGSQLSQPRGRLEQDLGEHRQRVVPLERQPPREAAEHHAPQSVDVGPGVDVPERARLLGRHVPGRPEHAPGPGHVRLDGGEARDAEVDDLGLVHLAAHEQHVARLDVAVDHARRVGRGQGRGDAAREGQRLVDRQRRPGEAGRERLALEPLHREVRLPSRGGAEGHEADDARVPDLRQKARLPREPLERAAHGPFGPLRVEDLEGHDLVRLGVQRAKDATHPPGCGEALDDETLGDGLHRAIVATPGAPRAGARLRALAWPRQAEGVEPVDQRSPGDPEHLGGLLLVAAAPVEGVDDPLLLVVGCGGHGRPR